MGWGRGRRGDRDPGIGDKEFKPESEGRVRVISRRQDEQQLLLFSL